MGQHKAKGLWLRNDIWHIDTAYKGKRIRGSTGESSVEKASALLNKKIAELREAKNHGVRPSRTFEQAATAFLEKRLDKVKSVDRDAQDLKLVMPYIGELDITHVHDDNLEEFKDDRIEDGTKPGTINRTLATVQNVLNCCTQWRDKDMNLTWLLMAPKITKLDNKNARKPYPVSWEEQDLLFDHMADHLVTMATWGVHTGCREQEIVGLKWDWEFQVNELGVSLFVLPGDVTKNGKSRLVVLNRTARRILEAQRGKHPDYVFTVAKSVHQDPEDRRSPIIATQYEPVTKIYNSGWKAARGRAAEAYQERFGRTALTGFAKFRVHDLRHTFASRLRSAGVSFEDRQDLLGHEAGRITTQYSSAEIGNLLAAMEKIAERSSHNSPTLTAVRHAASVKKVS